MPLKKGVFAANKKDGSLYYRASITYRNKHISLGSFDREAQAHKAYLEASRIIRPGSKLKVNDYHRTLRELSLEKWVCLVNFRDNKMYFKVPIYLKQKYFIYYLETGEEFKFDIDDLFFYSDKQIQSKQGYYFVNIYGSQTSILSRYGIKNHGVLGKDYILKNNDKHDFRYSNIEIINPYNGVEKVTVRNKEKYEVKIHINGYVKVGLFDDADVAAVAYNKAVNIAGIFGIKKNYELNYIDAYSDREYDRVYNEVVISDNYVDYLKKYNEIM